LIQGKNFNTEELLNLLNDLNALNLKKPVHFLNKTPSSRLKC